MLGELKCGVPRQTALGILEENSIVDSSALMADMAEGRDLMKGRGQDQKLKCGIGKYGVVGPLRDGSAGRE